MKTAVYTVVAWCVAAVIVTSVCRFSCCVVFGAPPESVRPALDEELRCEILYRRDVDQQVRLALIGSGAFSQPHSDAEFVQFAKQLSDVDQPNTARMKQIVAQYGWPGKSLVGDEGASAAWLLVQHSDDLPFMEQCLALMEIAAQHGEVSGSDLATLSDRVRWRQGKPQIYGTQFVAGSDGRYMPHPIDDEAHVDERRKSVGLPPMAEQERILRTTYGTQAISRQ